MHSNPSKFRVGIAGFLHESNTFLGTPTQYEDFVAASLTRGPALLERWRGTNHELGGMLEGCFEIVPLLATFAIPSGTISAECFERIAAELLQDLPSLDGLLIALHGATVSEQYPDADGELLRRIRERVGPAMPIIATLDLHANVSPRMIGLTTATVAYRTNPHLDQRERGLEAASLMVRTLRCEIAPVQALVTPPMLIQISKQYTSEEPAKLLYDDLRHVLTWPGILSASIAMGFYYADVEEMGASFWAVADGDPALAQRAAQFMADRAWARREELTGSLPSVEEAVREALASQESPIVLMDVGDNVGAGSPANSTVLFDEVLRQGGRDALVILYDPEAVQALTCPYQGKIRSITDGRFVDLQVRHGGWGEYDQGQTVVVETAQGHTIILTSRRMAPMSLEQILHLGIKPEEKKILIVKGVVAPRAAYAPIAARIVLVDTPGVTSDNPRYFDYRNRRRPLYPLD